MANPITWQNVNSRGNADAVALLDSAGRNVNAGLNRIGGIFKDREAAQERGKADGIKDNTQSFLDTLAGYQDADQLQTDIESGAIASLRSGFGDDINKASTRGAGVTRLNALRTQAGNTAKFEGDQLDRETASLRESISSNINSGNFDVAADLLGRNGDALEQSGNRAALESSLLKARDDKKDRDFTLAGRNRDETNRKSKEAASQLSNAALQSTNFDDARRAITEARLNPNSGITSADFDQLLLDLPGRFDAQFALGRDAQTSLDTSNASFEGTERRSVRDANTEYERAQENLPVSSKFAFLDERNDRGDAVQTAIGLGYDATDGDTFFFGEGTATRVLNARDDFAKTLVRDGNTLSASDNTALDAILSMAVKEQGSVGDGVTDNNDIDRSDLKRSLTRLWDEYQRDKGNRLKLNTAQDRRDRAIDTAGSLRATSSAANLETLQNEARARSLLVPR